MSFTWQTHCTTIYVLKEICCVNSNQTLETFLFSCVVRYCSNTIFQYDLQNEINNILKTFIKILRKGEKWLNFVTS